MEKDYTISPARYAKGKLVVRCPSSTGYKTRAARLIGDGLNCRWSNRAGGYIASRSQADRFERLYRLGFDASVISGAIDHRETGLMRMTWREALKTADAMEAAAPEPSCDFACFINVRGWSVIRPLTGEAMDVLDPWEDERALAERFGPQTHDYEAGDLWFEARDVPDAVDALHAAGLFCDRSHLLLAE